MRKSFFVLAALAVIILFIIGGLYIERTLGPGFGSAPTAALSGDAPDFPAGDTWLNSSPLKLSDLKGKVVLVDFWTYSCINCIRTLPFVTKWYSDYKDDGFVVVGVHTPEFAFEHDTQNVKDALARFGISYPVVQDNDYAIWNAYANEFWPAEYLLDRQGRIVGRDIGEGDYAARENVIRAQLGLQPLGTAASSPDLSKVRSPEMYFGTDRVANLDLKETPSSAAKDYAADLSPSLNVFSLGGQWSFAGDKATLTGPTGEIDLKFHSAKLYFVASSTGPTTLKVTVDGRPQPDLTVDASRLYQLFDSSEYSDHLVRIEASGAGLEAYTFTFG